jgi:hypothetical protein
VRFYKTAETAKQAHCKLLSLSVCPFGLPDKLKMQNQLDLQTLRFDKNRKAFPVSKEKTILKELLL